MTKIVSADHPVLRQIAAPVGAAEFNSPALRKIIAEMSLALAACDDGVALAAPQIGVAKRIFIVSRKIFTTKDRLPPAQDMVFINPTLIKLSRKREEMEEGCLSVRWFYGRVRRAVKASITAYDIAGQKFTHHASNLLAQIFQHETDHLNGVLFLDQARGVTEIKPDFIFWGTDDFAVAVLNELLAQAWSPRLIITTPDQPRGRNLKLTPPPVKVWAEKNHFPCLQPENLENLEIPATDTFLVASYGKIIPPEILKLPKFGALNLHPSRLPKYRGPTPLQTAILNGETETGVSLMLLDEQIDHGPILAAGNLVGIKNFSQLRDELAKLGAELFIQTFPAWLAGKIKPQIQDHQKATYTKKIKKEDGELKSTDSPELNYRKVLALNPNPGTYFIDDNGKRLKVLSARLEKGQLIFDRVIPEGKREMDWASYLRGKK